MEESRCSEDLEETRRRKLSRETLLRFLTQAEMTDVGQPWKCLCFDHLPQDLWLARGGEALCRGGSEDARLWGSGARLDPSQSQVPERSISIPSSWTRTCMPRSSRGERMLAKHLRSRSVNSLARTCDSRIKGSRRSFKKPAEGSSFS